MMKKRIILPLFATAALLGCGDKSASAPQMLPVVKAEQVTSTAFFPSKSYVGRIEAIEDAAITSQVTGYLESRDFREGQIVEQGHVLYQIDDSTYAAQVASATAAVAQAEAQLKKANSDFERAENLLPKGNISQSEYDTRFANKLSAEAQVKSAEANLISAEVDFSRTKIVAPFKGRTNSTKVSMGDLVSPSSGVLTTLVSLDPIQASFQISERERLAMGMDKASGDGSNEEVGIEVTLILENGKEYSHAGKLDFVGNRINLDTGTIALRAQIPNPDYALLPGQHVEVMLATTEEVDVVAIPRRAVQTDIQGDFVMVLSEGNVAERREVVLGAQIDEGIVIQTGLKETDKVIVEGLQRVRNGMPVQLMSEQGGA
jgi:membrane fusion protein (multidrug efflux system)